MSKVPAGCTSSRATAVKKSVSSERRCFTNSSPGQVNGTPFSACACCNAAQRLVCDASNALAASVRFFSKGFNADAAPASGRGGALRDASLASNIAHIVSAGTLYSHLLCHRHRGVPGCFLLRHCPTVHRAKVVSKFLGRFANGAGGAFLKFCEARRRDPGDEIGRDRFSNAELRRSDAQFRTMMLYGLGVRPGASYGFLGGCAALRRCRW